MSVERSGVIPEAQVELVRELPYRGRVDHPEGLVRWSDDRWLVVCDSPGPERLGTEPASLVADLWTTAAAES